MNYQFDNNAMQEHEEANKRIPLFGAVYLPDGYAVAAVVIALIVVAIFIFWKG